MWAEGTLNRSMTGILIYSVWSVFSHSPLSQANVKPCHSKPTLVTSKLKHDIIYFLTSLQVIQHTWRTQDALKSKCAHCAIVAYALYTYTLYIIENHLHSSERCRQLLTMWSHLSSLMVLIPAWSDSVCWARSSITKTFTRIQSRDIQNSEWTLKTELRSCFCANLCLLASGQVMNDCVWEKSWKLDKVEVHHLQNAPQTGLSTFFSNLF